MEVHFLPDVQEKLLHSAAKRGCDADELVRDVLARYLADEARFFEAVESWTDEEREAAMSHIVRLRCPISKEGFCRPSAEN
jgi:hypothetical protein